MTVSNVSASVRARLANRARQTNRPFSELLQYYAMERFLYRLSRSPYGNRFILKGALMLRVWDAPASRPTRDVDLLGHVDGSVEALVAIIREICAMDVEPDGLLFDPVTVAGTRIKEDAEYEGVRIRFTGFLDRARVVMQLDVGFGDVLVPGRNRSRFPRFSTCRLRSSRAIHARVWSRRSSRRWSGSARSTAA